MVEYQHMTRLGYQQMQWNKKDGIIMEKQQEKVFNQTKLRNLKRKCMKCIENNQIEEAIDLKMEIDQLQKRI